MPVTHLSCPLPLAVPSPLGPAMETVLPGDRGGRDPCQHVPQGPSTNPGKGASLSLQAGGPFLGAPRANASFRLFCTYFPLNLCALPLTGVHTLGLGSRSPVADVLWDSRRHLFVSQFASGYFVSCGGSPRTWAPALDNAVLSRSASGRPPLPRLPCGLGARARLAAAGPGLVLSTLCSPK